MPSAHTGLLSPRPTGRTLGRPQRTEHARAENRTSAGDSVRQSDEDFRRLVANLPDVTWSSDINGKTIYISPNVERVLGYTAQEICEKGDELWLGRIHAADRERVICAYEELFSANRIFDQEYRIQRKDGSWIWVHDRALRTYEKHGVRYADGVFSDVTDRKRAEEALQESEGRYRLLFERNLAGVFRSSTDGRTLDCNQALVNMLGYDSAAELLNRGPADYFYDAQEARRAFDCLFREHSLSNFELRLKRKDGTPLWALENVNLVDSEDGGPAYIEGTIIDISERKRAEEKIQSQKTFSDSVIQSLPVAFAIFDPTSGKCLHWNKSLEKVCGYSGAELNQIRILDTVAEEYRHLMQGQMEKAFATGFSATEAVLVAKGGMRIPVYLDVGTDLG